MSTSINRNFSPWDLLKFAAPSIIMMVFMVIHCFFFQADNGLQVVCLSSGLGVVYK